MKKIILIICILITIFVILGLTYNYKNKDQLIIKEEPIIIEKYALVYDIKDKLITIKNQDGTFLTLDINNQDITSLKIGDNILLTYKNDLKEENLKSIKKIEINLNNIPKSWEDDGLFKEYYKKAYSLLNTLSLEEKIGQLLLVRVPEHNQISTIKDYHLGGYILFGRDTNNETKQSLKDKIESYQQASLIPMIIAVDEEGGKVVRISNNKNLRNTKFLAPREIYNYGGLDAIKDTIYEMSNLLDELNINVNLAPVADISTNENDFIYSRTLGQDSKITSEYISTVIKASKENQVSYVLKHFPGYGNNKDTHTEVAIDNRTLENFFQNDLLPFKSGIKEQAEAILVSHNIITSIDPNNPASLSLNVHKIARDDLNFKGILITDDLEMDAIKKYTDASIVKALKADNDMLIITDYQQAFSDIKQALEKDILTENIINYHCFKVLAWKYYKGMLE